MKPMNIRYDVEIRHYDEDDWKVIETSDSAATAYQWASGWYETIGFNNVRVVVDDGESRVEMT
jgi:hypothetical protein